MASAQLGMVTGAGRGLQTSYSSRMQAQPQQQSGFNAAQGRVEVNCLLFHHLIHYISFKKCLYRVELTINFVYQATLSYPYRVRTVR